MEEQALIAAAQKGDVPAFNQLVLRYQTMVYNLAYVYARTGEAEAAIENLDLVLSIASKLRAESLRDDPRWDSIRDDPAFQALIEKLS